MYVDPARVEVDLDTFIRLLQRQDSCPVEAGHREEFNSSRLIDKAPKLTTGKIAYRRLQGC
jgi:hypothetical protein